jgi:hypothetical protein
METINDTYARYAGENHDLAISLTARELGLEECCVREVIDAGETRNGPGPRMRVARVDSLRRTQALATTRYPTLAR